MHAANNHMSLLPELMRNEQPAFAKSDSRPCTARMRTQRGAVLLEVILALVLFVAAATVIAAGINASLDSVERLRLNTHAANLAVSVLSELQMGSKTLAATGPQQFQAPFEAWTWEVLASPLDAKSAGFNSAATSRPTDRGMALTRVEVIIRHDDPVLVYRLNQVLPLKNTELRQTASIGASHFPQ